MKKVLSIIVAAAMIFSFTACVGEKAGVPQDNPPNQQQNQQPAPQLTPSVITVQNSTDMIMFVGGSRSWSPFESFTEFSVSDSEIVSLSSDGISTTFTALKAGEVAAAAECGGEKNCKYNG
ncbi:MAG: hypothetical protein J6J58_02820 [Oscillospiraceae bacterium]|nr:hypothetical protein [Oscillospiraceae bacterium]